MKDFLDYLDGLSGETILISMVLVFLITLYFSRKKHTGPDERNARTRYQQTEDLTEQIKQRRK